MNRPTFLLLALLGLTSALPSFAQESLRSSFPGRRVGGGTRGECSARIIVHLVPDSSVYAPGSSPYLAVLEGPTANPVPFEASYKTQGHGHVFKQTVAASPAGITILRLPKLSLPAEWESSYRCIQPVNAADDPLNFVTSSAPPALSLLVSDSLPADTAVQAKLSALAKLCGQDIDKREVARIFDLETAGSADWPTRLPVRCPS